MKTVKIVDNVKGLPFLDPSIKWYVQPALNHSKFFTGSTPATNSIQYSCDDAICFPRYFGGYMSWYDPSTGGVGGRMFNLQEAWDHTNWTNPIINPPYNGWAAIIPGYGGYFLAVPLTDGTNKVQVNIIHRYTDGSILIYNTGSDAGTAVNILVTVYDPPSGLGYNVQTNGTRNVGQTTLASGQYVLFYKGTTAPTVDTTTGLFSISPFGVNKSQPYELWTNSFVYWSHFTVPKMYLGVKAPGADMEVISNGAYPGNVYHSYITSGTSGDYGYPLIGVGGRVLQSVFSGSSGVITYNMSHITEQFDPNILICKSDPNVIYRCAGDMLFGAWFGWGEDDGGNVKFIILSQLTIEINTNFNEIGREYDAYIYDVDKGEGYFTGIIKPTVNMNSYRNLDAPIFGAITDQGSIPATAFGYIDANDTWNKITTAESSSLAYYNNAYGFCNYYSDKINCAEGLGIYTTDTSYTPPAPKSAFGADRVYNTIDARFIRVPSLENRALNAGQIYAVVSRYKAFPGTTTDTNLQNWFLSLQPRVLTNTDFNTILSLLPGSFWLFGEVTDTVMVSASTVVNTGSQFTVSVSCPTRPNTPIWVALVDQNGNIVASSGSNTDANGNASVTVTAPTTPGTYRIQAIVAGTRTLI